MMNNSYIEYNYFGSQKHEDIHGTSHAYGL